MNQTTNEILSTFPASLKSPIEVLNHTNSFNVPVTTDKLSNLDHVATTDLRNFRDTYTRLGYGDCKFAKKSIQKLFLNYKKISGFEKNHFFFQFRQQNSR